MKSIRRMFEGLTRFFKEVRVEMHKVAWPGRQEVVASTIVVIVATALLSIFIYTEDKIFSLIVEQILF